MNSTTPKRRCIVISLLITCLLAGLASYTPLVLADTHAPITIDGNHMFIAPNGVVSGTGTEADPFIIKNWVIDASTGNGIEVRNTDVYFIIRNCTIFGSPNYSSISFYNVKNGAIEGSSTSGNSRGVDLDQSSGNTIANNTMSSNAQYGVRIWYSPNNTVTGNTISDNGICGIVIDFSPGTTVSNNTISDNEEYGINIDSSTGNTLTSNSLINNEVGIFLGYSTSNTLTNNTVSQGTYGISIFASENRITGGSISGNAYGIYLKNAPWNIISNCSITGNTVYGIFYEPSDEPSFVADATECWWGSADGPSGVGPGSGDAVSSRVDYDPWLTAPWGHTQEYYVTIESSSGGTTMPSSGGWFTAGAIVSISATSSANYTFANWTKTGGVTIANPASSATTFTVAGNGTVRANFIPTIPTFTVIFQSTPGGTTSPSGSNSYPWGTTAAITATASPGHRFTSWTVVGNATLSNPSNATATLTVYGPANATAHFEEVIQHLVAFSHSPGGSTAPSGSISYDANATLAIAATPYPGYQFANWTVTGGVSVASPTSAETILTVSGSGTAYAYFLPLDITPPMISSLTPGSGSTTSGGAVSIGAAFSDDTAIDTSSVALKIDGAPVTTGLQVTLTGVTYATTLQPGTHSIELTVSDTQGNPRTVTWAFTVASASVLPVEYIAIGVVAVAVIAGVAFFVFRKKLPSGFSPD